MADSPSVKDVEEKLVKIKRKLLDVATERSKFIKCFPKWASIREKNISNLKSIAADLNKCKNGVTITNIVGSSVGAAGGVAGIVGAVLLPFPVLNIASPFLLIGGAVTSGLGGATNVGSAIFGSFYSSSKIKKAKKCLEDDRKCFSQLEQWFEIKFIGAVEELMNYEEFKSASKTLKILTERNDVDSGSLKKNNHGKKLDSVVELHFEYLNVESKEIMKIVLGNDTLISIWKEITALMDEFLPSLEMIWDLVSKIINFSCSTVRTVVRAVDAASDCMRSSSSIVRATTSASRSVARVAALGIINVAAVGFDIYAIVSNALELAGDTPSENAAKVLEAAQQMESQLRSIKLVYDALKCPDFDSNWQQKLSSLGICE